MAAKAYLEKYIDCESVCEGKIWQVYKLSQKIFVAVGVDSMPLDVQRIVSQLRELDRQTQRKMAGEICCIL